MADSHQTLRAKAEGKGNGAIPSTFSEEMIFNPEFYNQPNQKNKKYKNRIKNRIIFRYVKPQKRYVSDTLCKGNN